MKEPQQCENIEDIRAAIDEIDRSMINLLAKRAEYVHQAAKYKTSASAVKAEDRVKAMFAQRRIWAEETYVSPDFIEQLYKQIVEYFTSEEMKKWENQK